MLLTASSLTGQFQGCECVYHVPSLLYTMFPLTRIPALHFQYYEIAAAIRSGKARLEEVEKAESLCIDKLICMLWMRREEADARGKAELDRLAREMFAFFKPWPMYREITEIMEGLWTEGSIMQIYQ